MKQIEITVKVNNSLEEVFKILKVALNTPNTLKKDINGPSYCEMLVNQTDNSGNTAGR